MRDRDQGAAIPAGAAVQTFVRLSRADWAQRPRLICGLVTALLMIALIVTASLSLSAEQVAQRDLGRFDAEVSVASVNLEDRTKLDQLIEALPRGRSTTLTLTTTAAAPATFEGDRFVFREGDWVSSPFGGLTVSDGRWPQSVGEVTVDPNTARRFSVGSQISLASGSVLLEVVGVTEDAFVDHVTLYAYPGTWQSLPESAAGSLRLDDVYLSVLTTGAAQADVIEAFSRSALTASVVERDEIEAERSWVRESPFAFIIPALLLPLLGTALTAGFSRRRARRFVERAQDVGMPAGLGRVAARSAFVAWAVAGTLLGAVVGIVLGALLRRFAASLASQPSGPLPDVAAPIALILAGVLLGALVGFADLSISARPKTPWLPASAKSSSPRRWAALVAGCAAVFAYYRVDNVNTAMIFGAGTLLAWLLLAPDVVTVAARRLPGSGPTPRFAGRLLGGRDTATTAGVAVLTVLVALPTTTALMLTATGSTARDNALADVAPGQMSVDLGASDDLDVSDISQVTLTAIGGDHDRLVEVAVLDAWYEVASGNSLTLSVTTSEDAAALLGEPLTAAQTAELQDGGMLVWQPGYQLFIDDVPANPQPKAVPYQPAPEWRKQAGALMLDSTADTLGITSRPDKIVTTGSSPHAAERVRESLARSGVDATAVSTYHPPRTIAPPLAMTLSLATLILMLIATTYAAVRAHVASLRRQLQRLIAIGAPRHFSARVLALIQALTLLIALAAGVSISTATALALLTRNTGVELNPPYSLIVGYLAAVVTATGLSLALSVRTLRAAPARHG